MPSKPEVLLIEGPRATAGGSEGGVLRLASQPGLEAWEFTRIERLASAERFLRARTFQAIVIDLHLADADGMDAYRRARTLAPGLPMIALADTRDASLAEAVVNEGAQACLPKEGLTGSALGWALRQAVIRSGAEARRFRALFDTSPIGILLAAGRKVAMANPAALQGLGYGEADLLRLSVVDLFPADRRSAVERALDIAGAVGEVPDVRFSAALRRADGTVAHCQVYLEGALLNDAPAVSIYLAFAEAGPGLSRAQKMEALSRMAGGISHDFLNPLTAINGYAEHLMTLAAGDGQLAHGLSAIRRAGEAAAALARGLGEFGSAAATGSEPPEEVRVDLAVDHMAPALSALLGRSAELRIRPGAGSASVRLPRGQLERMLRDLVARARGAGGSGIVTLATGTCESGSAERCTHLSAGPGPQVVIEIGDGGEGLDPAAMDRLFEPFAAGADGTREPGVGLAAVYAMVQQAGGGIAVASDPGRGSRIRILLPAQPIEARAALSPRPMPSVPEAKPPKPLAPPVAEGEKSGTVLVVEDEQSMREMLAAVLKRFGYAVLETVSESEAVKAAAAHPETDLVISDITLRGSYGHEMVERLRVMRPGLPAIFVSGHPLEYLADQGIKLPPGAFLEKPFTPSQLALKVREMLGTRKYS